jgi:3-oxoacyl-[acyl-carrier-protein] synthase-1
MLPAARSVITAMGLTSALGDSLEETRRALRMQTRLLSAPPMALPFQTVCGALVGPLDPLPSALAAYESRMSRIALRALVQLTEPVERARAKWGAERVGVVLGSSTGGLDRTEHMYRALRRAETAARAIALSPAHPFDAACTLAAELFRVTGPRYAISTACTSSAKAIASALRLIEHGVCDAVISGGCDALCETTLRGFHSLGVLSPSGARPFSAERDGTHLGEGAAFMLLERNGDGATWIASVGESSDAHAMSAPHPEGRGAATAIQAALAAAHLEPSQVEYVNAHGTGTEQNDAAEALAISRTLGGAVPVSSTKGLTGHLLGAAGAIELAISALAVSDGWLPGNAGGTPLAASLGIQVITESQPRRIRNAISNSLAFGGSNTAVLVMAS